VGPQVLRVVPPLVVQLQRWTTASGHRVRRVDGPQALHSRPRIRKSVQGWLLSLSFDGGV